MERTDDAEPWWSTAHMGIIGLAPEPWNDPTDAIDWPTEGYDGPLARMDWEESKPFAASGHTREEWLALADEMIRRWTAWRAHIATLPDHAASP